MAQPRESVIPLLRDQIEAAAGVVKATLV